MLGVNINTIVTFCRNARPCLWRAFANSRDSWPYGFVVVGHQAAHHYAYTIRQLAEISIISNSSTWSVSFLQSVFFLSCITVLQVNFLFKLQILKLQMQDAAEAEVTNEMLVCIRLNLIKKEKKKQKHIGLTFIYSSIFYSFIYLLIRLVKLEFLR